MCSMTDFDPNFPDVRGPVEALRDSFPQDSQKAAIYANRGIFETFIDTMNKPFGKCLDGKCLSTDGSSDTIHLTTSPDNFGFTIKNDKDPAFSGSQIKCAMSEDTCFHDPNKKMYKISCEANNPRNKAISYSYKENPGVEIKTNNGLETKVSNYNPFFKSKLLESFIKEAATLNEVEVSSQLRTWAYPVVSAGIAGALFFGYKTFQALKTGFGSHPTSTAAEAEKQRAEQTKAKKKALIYGSATATLMLLGAYTFLNATDCPTGSNAALGKCYRAI